MPEEIKPVIPPTPLSGIPANAIEGAWRCSNNHILGAVIREKVNHSKTVTRLVIFRGALHPEQPANQAIPFAKIDGGEVVCGFCGEIRVWRPGDSYIQSLLDRRKFN
jgi:hypothetical protein